MSSSKPVVSVCIPAYNAEASIGRCIGSILAQNLSGVEIVVVDNCSTDGTVEVAEAALTGVANARIIRNEANIGRVPNWNRCIELAQGAFVKFLFTNDVMLPHALDRLSDLMLRDDTLVMAGSLQMTVLSVPDPLPPVPDRARVTVRGTKDTLIHFAHHGFNTLGSLNGMIYRRAPILEHGLWFRDDIPYFADFVQAMEMSTYGQTAFLNAETYCFDESAVGRYHFVGQQQRREFLVEHRKCTARHMEILERCGLHGTPAMNYLLGRYIWYLSQGWKLSPGDALATFSGNPRLQALMAAKTFWFNTRNALCLR